MCYIQNIAHPTSRWLEIFCVLFGHDWSSYESETNDAGRIEHEANQCARCKLAKRIVYIPTERVGTRKRMAY